MTAIKILLADDDAERAGRVTRALEADAGVRVFRAARGQLLADAIAAHAPDVILADMSRPDRDALEGLRQAAEGARPIVLFVDEDDPGFMEAAIAAGVCSYNVIDLPPPDVKPILRAAIALFRRHEVTQSALLGAQARLSERAVIERAKAVLRVERRMSEPEAHRWLQRRAMAAGRRLVDVAEEVVQQRKPAP